MKTIAETVKDNEPWSKAIIAALEAREAERDAIERERVCAAIEAWGESNACMREDWLESLADEIYPPPKPEKLPARYWWNREIGAKYWYCQMYHEAFEPMPGWEYRPVDDPPPEVLGKTEPVVLSYQCDSCGGWACPRHECQNKTSDLLPTFEEWCAANGFDANRWYQSPGAALNAIKAALLKLGRIRE